MNFCGRFSGSLRNLSVILQSETERERLRSYADARAFYAEAAALPQSSAAFSGRKEPGRTRVPDESEYTR